MKPSMDVESKQEWISPEFQALGSIEEVTQQTKDYGVGDGFVLLTPDNPLKTVGSL